MPHPISERCVRAPELVFELGPRGADLADALDARLRAHGVALLRAVVDEVPAFARGLVDVVRPRIPAHFCAEAEAFAEEYGVSSDDVLLANLSYDLVLAQFGCSTVALATPEGPVLARNMDWWPEDLLARSTVLAHYREERGARFSTASWPGGIGAVTGQSARGFAIALNAVSGAEPADPAGYPVLLFLRDVLETASGFDAAVDRLAGESLASGGMFTVVGSTNEQRVVVERSPSRSALRSPRGDEPLVTTNDYRALTGVGHADDNELGSSSCGRFDRLTALAAKGPAGESWSDGALLAMLTDPEVEMQITCQHVVMRPRAADIGVWCPRRLL